MANAYLVFKALHVIGFVSWFGGLFYLVRIFVYHAEIDQKAQELQNSYAEMYALMESRAFKIIATPAMVITWLAGIIMLLITPSWLEQGWMHAKLFFLLGLTGYHFYCKRIIKKFAQNQNPLTSFQFRLLNELPTIFLAGIAFLAVFKSLINFGYLLVGLGIFIGLLYFAAKAYKRKRERN